MVLATSFTDPADGTPAGALRAVDLGTHQRRWGVAAGDEVGSAPEISHGVVFVGIGARKPGTLDRDWLVDGFNLADPSGPFRQRFQAAVIASVATDGTRLWAASFDDSVYAFAIEPSSRSLRQLWSFTTGTIISASPVIGDGLVYVAGDDGSVVALDPGRSGAERWRQDVGSPVDVSPVLDAGTLVAAGRDGRVHAYDAATGQPRWTVGLHAQVKGSSGGLAAAADRVVVCDSAGIVHLLDLATGAEHASWTAPAVPRGTPAIAAGFVYVTVADGRLYALPL